jgi:hypothetical protein
VPIKEYVLIIHDPVENVFKRQSHFVTSSSPFPVPHVGDEIDLGAESPGEAKKVRRRRVVSRVAHYVELAQEGVVHHLDVYTTWKPSPGA